MGIDIKTFTADPDITPEALAEMRVEVADRIIIARVGLLLRHPFFGNMATRLIVKNCDDWCPTAATDGRHLYYNTQFFNAMSNKEIEFVIAHEILHCVFDHLGRREDRNPILYNIAADYIVNNTLMRDRIGEMVKIVSCYQDFKYEGWTSEAVYDDLFKQQEEKGEEYLKQLGEMLDEHVDWGDEDGNGKGDSGSEDGSEGKSGRPSYSKDELAKIKDEIKENMMSAAQAAGAGNVPGEVARMIKELTEPKMNWREFTFSRPSRKGWHTGAILPGMNFADTIDVAIGIDMSGSIGDAQGKDFISEVKGIMDEYQEYNIKMWCFDTKVYNEQDFSADNGEDLLDYKLMGGGGTDFDANWNYMKEEGYVPKKFIMFTDGYPWRSWGDEDYCETIFIIHGHHDKDLKAPFGQTAHYDEAA